MFGGFAQNVFYEIAKDDIPGFAGQYEDCGANSPVLIVLIKNPSLRGTEILASELSVSKFKDTGTPNASKVFEVIDERIGKRFGTERFLSSTEQNPKTLNANDVIKFRYVDYDFAELTQWKNLLINELAQEVGWVTMVGIDMFENKVLLLVDEKTNIPSIQEELDIFLADNSIPVQAIKLGQGSITNSGSKSSGSTGGGNTKNLGDKERPLVAGLEIELDGGECTLGWFAKRFNTLGFVTAWHCSSSSGDHDVFQDRQIDSGEKIAIARNGHRSATIDPYDVLFAQAQTSNYNIEVAWPTSLGSRVYTGSTKRLYDVIPEASLSNGTIYMVGNNSGRQNAGTVRYIDLTSPVTNVIFSCTTHSVIGGGDSGGPVILDYNGVLWLAGIIHGFGVVHRLMSKLTLSRSRLLKIPFRIVLRK